MLDFRRVLRHNALVMKRPSTLIITRLAPGRYLVNDRFNVRRVREGALHTSGVAWVWRDGDSGKDSVWHDTLNDALLDIKGSLPKGGTA